MCRTAGADQRKNRNDGRDEGTLKPDGAHPLMIAGPDWSRARRTRPLRLALFVAAPRRAAFLVMRHRIRVVTKIRFEVPWIGQRRVASDLGVALRRAHAWNILAAWRRQEIGRAGA